MHSVETKQLVADVTY